MGLYKFSRLQLFKSALQKLFKEERTQSLPVLRVKDYVNAQYSHDEFGHSEIEAALHKMTEDNHVMVADEIVFLI